MGYGIIAGNLNEIKKDDLATLRRFILGSGAFLSPQDGNNFSITVSGNKVTIGRGILCVDGYCGYSKGGETFNFINAATEQYWFIYGELDMSLYPNGFTIKRVNNGRSTERSFRQDVLASERSGVYQLPLWMVKVTNAGIVDRTDLRKMDAYYVDWRGSWWIITSLSDYSEVYTKYSFDPRTGVFSFSNADKIQKSAMVRDQIYYLPYNNDNTKAYEVKKVSGLLLNYRRRTIYREKETDFTNATKLKNVYNCIEAESLDGLNPVVDSNVVAVTQSNGTSNTTVATTAFVHNVLSNL